MRTKKEIRKSEKKRKILGLCLMGIGLLLIILGYLMCEFKPSFIVTFEKTSLVAMIIVSVIWFLASIGLFFSGLMIFFRFKVRHHDYKERKYSSRV